MRIWSYFINRPSYGNNRNSSQFRDRCTPVSSRSWHRLTYCWRPRLDHRPSGTAKAPSSQSSHQVTTTPTMRWLQLLTASLLPFTAFAAKKSTSDRFNDFRSKSLSAGSLKLDDASYAQLTKAPRDYSVAVLLTALETRFGCSLCREFQPEWDLLSRSWVKGDKNAETRLLFGTLDFVDGKNTFQSVWLILNPIGNIVANTGPPVDAPNRPSLALLPSHYRAKCKG